MSNPKHTPGPWLCEQYAKCFGIKAQSGRQIAIMTEHHGDEPQTPMYQFDRSAQDAADARLIAAAPDVLSALKSAHRMLTILFEQYNYGDSGLIRECGEAIAKATGGGVE